MGIKKTDITLVFIALAIPLWLGGQEIPLTSDSYHHKYPQWNPAGTFIVFEKIDASTYSQIYKVAAASPYTQTHLTTGIDDETDFYRPEFSPDNTKVVCEGYPYCSSSDRICIVPAAGGASQTLVEDGDNSTSGTHRVVPQWNPAGTFVVYRTYNPSPVGCQISKMSTAAPFDPCASNGGASTTLATTTNTNPGYQNPQWSFDGNWIVYSGPGASGTGYEQITKCAAGGGSETILTADASQYFRGNPQWKPDGTCIAYKRRATVGGIYQIYTVPSAGGTETQITTSAYNHYEPQWSPDGNWIVCVVYDNCTSPHYQICKVKVSDGTETYLTNDAYNHRYPQWSPDGTYIVYNKIDATGCYQIYKIDATTSVTLCPCTTPSITSQPGNTTICSGGSSNFSVTASGTAPLNYQWQYNSGTWNDVVNGTPAGAVYTNQTTTTMTVSGITAAGSYQYHCVVTNACGSATSDPATLTVNSNNTITLTSAVGTDNQTLCINIPIIDVTYVTTGATGATFSGLPAGVTGVWLANNITISGTPTISGILNYTITLTGGCP